MIVDMISSLGRSVIKFFRALGRSGFMLFGALVGKPQIRKHFPLLVKQLYAVSYTHLDVYKRQVLWWKPSIGLRLCLIGRCGHLKPYYCLKHM